MAPKMCSSFTENTDTETTVNSNITIRNLFHFTKTGVAVLQILIMLIHSQCYIFTFIICLNFFLFNPIIAFAPKSSPSFVITKSCKCNYNVNSHFNHFIPVYVARDCDHVSHTLNKQWCLGVNQKQQATGRNVLSD